MLLTFLQQRGRSLESEGCAELGLSYSDALEFLHLLEAHSVALLGIDIWRHKGNRYGVDHAAIWYSSTPAAAKNYNAVRSALLAAEPGPQDVVAIQFKLIGT